MVWAWLVGFSYIISATLGFHPNNHHHGFRKKLLVVSMDGFRWDYLHRVMAPNFQRLSRLGVRAPYMNNTFITKTFPCHYTMATGLYEESHGIVSNHMYDPMFGEMFHPGNTFSKWWDGGEPIWVTAAKQGLRSATYFWPGSDARIKGHRPHYWVRYNRTHPFQLRVDTMLHWFNNANISLGLIYFEQPDTDGHKYGPSSQKVLRGIRQMDMVLGYILDQMDLRNLTQQVNIIVTSDHGMADVNKNQVVDLSRFVNSSMLEVVPDKGPVCNVRPRQNMIEPVYKALYGLHPAMMVYRKEQLPVHWHYKNHRRVQPLVIVMQEGWRCTDNMIRFGRDRKERGAHGYDDRLMSMKPIFFARGPDFKENHVVRPFRSVDLYPLMCKILGLTPAPNNGSYARTRETLRYPNQIFGTAGMSTANQILSHTHLLSYLLGLILFIPYIL